MTTSPSLADCLVKMYNAMGASRRSRFSLPTLLLPQAQLWPAAPSKKCSTGMSSGHRSPCLNLRIQAERLAIGWNQALRPSGYREHNFCVAQKTLNTLSRESCELYDKRKDHVAQKRFARFMFRQDGGLSTDATAIHVISQTHT
jgi:hypothetical protein